jgi:hypothetical protein
MKKEGFSMKHLRIMIAVLLALSLFLSGCATEDRTSSVTEKNPVAKALDVLKRLDQTVRPEEYTEASYAAYANSLGVAVDRLQNDVMTPAFVEDLKRRVFTAYLWLE